MSVVQWTADPAGTVNPAKLYWGEMMPEVIEIIDDDDGISPTPTDPAQVPTEVIDLTFDVPAPVPTPPPPPPPPRRPSFPLPRISTDWDLQKDIVFHTNSPSNTQALRKEFETCHVPMQSRRPTSAGYHASPQGYFLDQTAHENGPRIPVDPKAAPGSYVVVDHTSRTIYDVYLLQADIMTNVNRFRRHQIVHNPATKTYSLMIREGRVGLEGTAKQGKASKDIKNIAPRFRSLFRDKTGITWDKRFEPCFPRDGKFTFIALDYRGTISRPQEFPDYSMLNPKVNDEVRDLMEFIMYGGPIQQTRDPAAIWSIWSPFTAPYEHLSRWAVFSAFKTIEHIRKHLESPAKQIHWKSILRASSRYRSQIPFCAGPKSRAPVISSYYAIFLELKFLHSLWPRQQTASLLAEISRRACLQLSEHKSLAQPLYQAYSSLRHGFRRLTDSQSIEFIHLKAYLETSTNRTAHSMIIELQDIYRVFIKANLPNPYRDWIDSRKFKGPELWPNDLSTVDDSDRRLLWHGTQLDSLMGILDIGLQIRRPGANFNGSMFGNGIYLADTASKSAGYCKHQHWGQPQGEAVLLLCEADIGAARMRKKESVPNAHELVKMSGGATRCVEGMGKTGPVRWTGVWWDMGGLPYAGGGCVTMPDTTVPYGINNADAFLAFNEYVIYDPAHLLIRYLFRVKIRESYRRW
ncbi:poly polymerase catalytic domain-containing protein [Podospora didyma]|uniref:Poly [ADP-ribose] polymerase n=1 Tax=Podospora didyma TaxID=330526 RepID=A0AAE0K193_9PEZI|nr:poly polymerase catalytic domain-containing protein [Podospora didyma]